MIYPQDITIDDYTYILPDERIAKFPLEKRDHSKLLLYKNNQITETVFNQIANHLPEGCTLYFNNTKVIQARLFFHKSTGAKIEIFCLEPYSPADYESAFQQTSKCSWLCLVGNVKKWKDDILSQEISIKGETILFEANLIEKKGDSFLIEFSWNNPDFSFAEILDYIGELPIPPYLNRRTEVSDLETYQTVYSKIKGSVAAPTAGLHFTEDVFTQLAAKNIQCKELTLHVGAGTFRPVKTETLGKHEMHTEFFTVSKECVEHLLHQKGPVIAVGTTSVRTLESLYYLGKKNNANSTDHLLEVKQWEPYEATSSHLSLKEALQNILDYLTRNNLNALRAETQIMIVPGYNFRVVDGIITNFHQPKSTLLLLVSAFLQGNWEKIYKYALEHDFRFLSYGDSSLLWKE